MSDTDIAIIGMACRFPGSENVEEFWANLEKGIESLNDYTHYEPALRNKEENSLHFIKVNNLIRGYDCFDADFFAISEREAKLIDPQHRLFLECAWSALEHAGYCPATTSEKLIGLYAGVYANYYLLQNIYSNIENYDPASELSITLGNEKDHLTTFTAYKLNLKGPVLTVQSTCSSGLASVHLACESLLTYSSDVMLAGGVTLSVPQIGGYYYQGGGLLSRNGQVRAFDSHASGTVYSNGVGVVVLKRLSDAQEDHDTIYAVIKGSALNNDGSTKVGYVAPSIEGQMAVIRRALRNADVDSNSITLLEGHGTGTPMGDGIELEALLNVYEGVSPGNCALGSVKSNIGHLGPAAGISGLIKLALSLYHSKIPASLNFQQPNEKLKSSTCPFYVNTQTKKWDCIGKKRAGLSSFGLGGTNVHAILEEPPKKERESNQPDETYIFCLSAKNALSLQKIMANMQSYLERNPFFKPHDIAYTLLHGRHHFDYRFSTTFQSTTSLIEQLKLAQEIENISLPRENQKQLVLHIKIDSSNQLRNLIQLIHLDPLVNAHFHHICQQYKAYCHQIEVDWDNLWICFRKDAQLYKSSSLFLFTLYYTLTSLALDLGLSVAGIAAEGIGQLIAIFISKKVAIHEFLPLILSWEHCFSMDSFLKSKGGLWESLLSKKSCIPIYHLSNQTLHPLNLNELDLWSNSENQEIIHDESNILISISHFHLHKASGKGFQYIIADLWQQGFNVNWEKYWKCLHKETTAYRIPLPTYAFQRTRYWLEEKTNSHSSEKQNTDSLEGDIEQEMICLWKKYLGTEQIEIEDNFFEKGGTSLIATSLISGIQQHFQVEMELKDLFEDPTLKGSIDFVMNKTLFALDDKDLDSLIGNSRE